MVPQAAIQAAHASAVMVQVHGPDPKGRKMRKHAFYHTESGDTTLSASGLFSVRSAAIGASDVGVQLENGSCSSSIVVVTCASIIEPFLSREAPRAPHKAEFDGNLIQGTEIDVLVEVPNSDPSRGEYRSHYWVPAHLDHMVDVADAGAALQAVLDVHGGSLTGSWEVGWTLTPSEASSQIPPLGSIAPTAQSVMEIEPSRRLIATKEPEFRSAATNGISKIGSLSAAATRVAILGLNLNGVEVVSRYFDAVFQQAAEGKPLSNDYAGLPGASSLKKGDSLVVVGSPFGTLSPLHFHNSLSAGIVSNLLPPSPNPAALIMADMRCLPGMEGGPVFDREGALVGMLIRPLRLRAGGVEVQLLMTSTVLASSLRRAGVALGVPISRQSLESRNAKSTLSTSAASILLSSDSHGTVTKAASPDSTSNALVAPGITRALSSVVLVTVGDGGWASGVIISETGLILTNAHLLEPWRFGKMRSSDHLKDTLLSTCGSVLSKKGDRGASQRQPSFDDCSKEGSPNRSEQARYTDTKSLEDPTKSPSKHTFKPVEVNWGSYQRIRVRLERDAPTWYNAEPIYVSQGPLDVALLQVVSPPPDLSPIPREEACPLPGSTATVIGHGLFGPRAELSPSITSGVVAKVVKAVRSDFNKKSEDEDSQLVYSAMLQTTAAVHPGGSGGAVVNSLGKMIALVTSNARHSGGSMIPYLNFSVPCGALTPIFDFASKDTADMRILSKLEEADEFLSAIWALVPSTPPLPPRLLPPPVRPSKGDFSPIFPIYPGDDPEKGNPKGSQFAKYISRNGHKPSFSQPSIVENGQTSSPRKHDLGSLPSCPNPSQYTSRL